MHRTITQLPFLFGMFPCEDWSSMCNESFSFLDNVMDSSSNFKRILSVLGHDYFKHLGGVQMQQPCQKFWHQIFWCKSFGILTLRLGVQIHSKILAPYEQKTDLPSLLPPIFSLSSLPDKSGGVFNPSPTRRWPWRPQWPFPS